MMFTEFPKMARLSRECIITEKIDGTNAQVMIREMQDGEQASFNDEAVAMIGNYRIYAGSRTRWVSPQSDNYGWAAWVVANAEELVKLGPGSHFGEWWGQGIQRKYGMKEKRFSLFNVDRWNDDAIRPACCHVVPQIYRGEFRTEFVFHALASLRENGSFASPGFMNPEGVVVFHIAGNVGFKKTIEKDKVPKGMANANSNG